MKSTTPQPSLDLDPPRRPGGRYELRSRLGRGGAGEVWSATDALTGELVAVKLLQPLSGQSHARVRREVAALRLLRIPGVVRLLDEGIEGGWVYLVMEYVRGRPFPGVDLPCTWRTLEPIALALLDTLGRIHAAGVVHRDLKPENVLVTPEGVPVVLDFGIARAPIGEDLTTEGEFLGTPIYTAPEAAQGEICTPRSDFFSLGVMLFEALSAELPYPSGSRLQALYSRVMNPARPLADVAPEVPADTARAVSALLQRDPNARPATAMAAKALLRGQRWDGEELRLPWVGPRSPVESMLLVARAGRRADLVGASGTGRSHVLRAVEEQLAAEGVTVHRLVSADRPFASLGEMHPGDEAPREGSADAMLDAVRARFERILSRGDAIVADDAERLDAATRRVLEGLREGAVLRALLPTAASPHEIVTLRPWSVEHLTPLFAGPERVLHARSDAAEALLRRTGGVASRVIAELRLWVQGGWAARVGPQFEVSREALDQLSSAPRLRAPGARHLLPPDLTASERDLLSGVAVAWPDGDPPLLARVLRRPPWEVELDARALEERGLLRVTSGRFEPLIDLWCDWSEDRRASAHRTLASALPRGAERRLMHLIAGATGDESARAIGDETLTRASSLARDGHLAAAVQALDEGLRAVRRVSPADTVVSAEILRLWTECALLQESAGALDRALYALCREPSPPEADAWVALVRAALAGMSDGARALELVEAIAPLSDPDLERRRQTVRVLASRSASIERERAVVLDAIDRLGGSVDPRDRSCAAGWLGRLRYREGRFAEAASLQEAASTSEPWVGLRVIALSRAASAHMEGFCFEDAERLARETLALAARSRNVHSEALAEWVLRTVAYRTGRATEIDDSLVEAVRRLGVRHIEALVCFTEAAVGWRLGEWRRASALAQVARANWAALGLRAQAALARCLSIASGDEASGDERDALAAHALECRIAGVGVQALALLDASHVAREGIASLALQVPRARWSARIDVLSVAESLTRLGVSQEEIEGGAEVALDRPSLSAPGVNPGLSSRSWDPSRGT